MSENINPKVLATVREYQDLRDRKTNPEGTFDKQGRFYLAEYSCCQNIRSPSRRFPYSEMKHGRTLKHVATKNGVDLKACRKVLKEIEG
ncbi:hypothetical protein [Bacteroides sp.]|uniref:hypothetical protein n=1 Tax=Bacteroides sp. TaxID=29523 RepID=UPI0026389E2D|nr:hypothetical protein [Bacteroides sp.]MDD3040767.1 hypothetical protein [Bacteroides sp.]